MAAFPYYGPDIVKFMRIGWDFDGTLAIFPQNYTPDFDRAEEMSWFSAALPAAVASLRRALQDGHNIVVITGRGEHHVRPMAAWLRAFTGRSIRVVGRPDDVSISSSAQAAWKASCIKTLDIDCYVGDRPRIDREAAMIACVPYHDAALFLQGRLLRWTEDRRA